MQRPVIQRDTAVQHGGGHLFQLPVDALVRVALRAGAEQCAGGAAIGFDSPLDGCELVAVEIVGAELVLHQRQHLFAELLQAGALRRFAFQTVFQEGAFGPLAQVHELGDADQLLAALGLQVHGANVAEHEQHGHEQRNAETEDQLAADRQAAVLEHQPIQHVDISRQAMGVAAHGDHVRGEALVVSGQASALAPDASSCVRGYRRGFLELQCEIARGFWQEGLRKYGSRAWPAPTGARRYGWWRRVGFL
ncbi:hypothetical protein D9M71_396950 [compost metagenome]